MHVLRCWARVPLRVTATIVIETGVQNTVLALAIANLTTSAAGLTNAEAFRLQLLVIVWGVVVSIEAIVVMPVIILLRKVLLPYLAS